MTTRHPDAEALSAYLDGETAEWESHVRGCPDCRRQLEALERVRAAVGAPVPPADPSHKEAAVAAALAGGERHRSASHSGMPRWAALAGVAAVVVGVVVGVAATRDSGSKQKFAAVGKAVGPVSNEVVNAGDLGDITNDAALRERLEPRLQKGVSAAAAGDAGASPTTSTPSEGARRAPSAGAQTESASGAAPCEREARELQPGTEVLVYRATGTWQGTPASVLAFSPPDAPATSGRRVPTRVYVLARSDCRLLSFQSYAP